MGTLAAVETLIALMLRNRFVWLALALALYLIGQLSWWQLRFDRFDTITLMSHITVVFEAGLLAVALLLALALPRLREAWYARANTASQPFGWFRAVAAANLVLVLGAVILLTPILVLHRYPELIEHDINVPLMMLQRATLLLLVVASSFHLMLVFRFYLRWAWFLCGLLGVAAHTGLGYWVTHLSANTEFFRRLNDLFYYNQLVPELQRPQVFHNIEAPFFPYFFTALALWLFTLLLLAPGASTLTRREKSPEPATSP